MCPIQNCTWIFIFLAGLLFQTGTSIKCSQCDSTQISSCLNSPPPPQDCKGLEYCIVLAKYTSHGQLVSFARSCSPIFLAESCVKGIDKATNEPRQICYNTCSADGCNGFTYLYHLLDLLRRR